MASAWGSSWGSAWGNSWGIVGVVPEPPPKQRPGDDAGRAHRPLIIFVYPPEEEEAKPAPVKKAKPKPRPKKITRKIAAQAIAQVAEEAPYLPALTFPDLPKLAWTYSDQPRPSDAEFAVALAQWLKAKADADLDADDEDVAVLLALMNG